MSNKLRAAIHNLGCKVNAYEAERMAEKLQKAGYEIVSFEEPSDYYIVNTCSVTNIADRKTRQMLHRARKNNPEAVIVAAGCYVDTAGGQTDNSIDIAVPNSSKEDIADILKAWEESHDRAGKSGESRDREGAFPETWGRGEGIHTRRFLKVQDGCNMFCSYCIIPYARGRIKSRSISDVLSETKELAGRGSSEFVLTGIHLSSFGKEKEDPKECLTELIKRMDETEGVKRIRLGSLEPTLITEEFIREIKGIESLCPHFHLSLQSGCDSVLKRMNRHYTGEGYLNSVRILREAFEDPAITTDVIVGFPGETEEEFEVTKAFLREADLYETHIFPYSRRRGTPAERMEGQLTEKEKHKRLEILKAEDQKRRRAFEDRHIGKEAEVLFEDCNQGYTREYIRVRLSGNEVSPGTIIKGRIAGRMPDGRMEFLTD